jgi:hypothetical protein
MDLPGALLDDETAAQFLTLGGSAAYLYGLEPNTPIHEGDTPCPTYGNLAVFLSDDQRHIRCRLPAYYALRLLTQEWAIPVSSAPHTLYTASYAPRSGQAHSIVTAYAVHRPDNCWSVLLLNKDPKRTARVRLRFRRTASGAVAMLHGPMTIIQYSRAQYLWHRDGEHGYPSPDRPPAAKTVAAGIVALPPFSLTVVRGRLALPQLHSEKEAKPCLKTSL